MTQRTDAPGPLRRRGPRPLLLHLMLAMQSSPGCVPGWPNWNAASPPSSDDRAFLSLPPNNGPPNNGAAADPPGLDPALIAGIAAYRRHPYQRELADPPVIWEEGGSRILDYGPAGAPPLLVVPSLVNRAYVLDLSASASGMRKLAAGGVRPLLLDWGWPGAAERGFTLTDYVAGRLERAISAVGVPLVLAGYCMGGLLALAAAQRRPDLVRAVALLATPWDFHAGLPPHQSTWLAQAAPLLRTLTQISGTLPVDALQTMFALNDPASIARKYRGFGRLAQDSARARNFVALEDWLNDGVPLAAPVAEECLVGWYGANSPARGAWRIAGLPVIPAAYTRPAFVAIPARDRIVPPDSAMALAQALPAAHIHLAAAGHIGMAAGSTANACLWQPLLGWLRTV